MTEVIQLDLFEFAAQQIQVISETAPLTEIMPKNFQNLGKQVMPTTTAARITANFEAIRLLKHLPDNRILTAEEQETLAKFSGWGGLTEVFMEGNRHFDDLKDLLSPEEYETAQSSMLDSFYTPEFIIGFMWQIARQDLDIKAGRVAELGCGTGNFIGFAPSRKSYNFTGIEVDKISGNIAKILYPESEIHVESIEKVKLSNTFDLVIGNVPFGKTAPYDRNFRSYNAWNLHNYFIARALDALKPNGYAVLLTSSSSMDRPGSMAQITNGQAGLVKAFRLPKNTFAGTEIVADILVLQKGITDELSGNLATVKTGDGTGAMEINGYFAKYPEHVFGILSNTGKMYGKLNTPTVLPDEKTLQEHFQSVSMNNAVKNENAETNLFGELVPNTVPQEEAKIPEEVPVPAGSREYSIFCHDDLMR